MSEDENTMSAIVRSVITTSFVVSVVYFLGWVIFAVVANDHVYADKCTCTMEVVFCACCASFFSLLLSLRHRIKWI